MGPRLKEFLGRWVINTAAVLVAANVVPGITYSDSLTSLVVASLVLGILNAFLKPLLMLVAFPLVVLTLGLFTFVINALLLYWVGHWVKGFHVDTFGAALLGAVVIFVVSLVLNTLTGTGNSRISMRRGGPPKPKPPPDIGGSGPVIDV
jgi:putative membrane protein